MAKDYESEAHVVIDGEEVPVYARFTVFADGPMKSWHGVIGADEPGLAFKLVNAQRTLLRMPSGKEAPIVPGGRDSSEGIAFTGSGPAPI
ncbi:hypothetical protein ACH49_16695 [Streptomyces leeuwenhoekii]|uniref:Uncharacterized protein n=1 Tax=Streptomyces leeuwenhoekii TaxID=1437453 RepID=A0ABR5HXA7_STRLW|nr:hypothetical protein [Streptomyces leeuwenhoekii]KMS78320.1 hypothetical protein ACH49_16695 [Streptomyces leeuwenhoekii]